MAELPTLADLDLWLILGSPRGRLRSALTRACRAEDKVTVVNLETYLRPEKELPRTEGGAWNYSHEDAVDWDHLQEDLKHYTGEVIVICDDRSSGCKALVDACKRMILCSSTELGCLKDCILSRVSLEDYTHRIWPTYQQRATRFWAWLVEDATLRRKVSILDEDFFRDSQMTREALNDFAVQHLEEVLEDFMGKQNGGKSCGTVWMLQKKEIGQWRGRLCDVPKRNQRMFQQARKDVLYSFELEARSFATSMTKKLLTGNMKDALAALKDLENYRMLLPAMSQEERAKWASVICTREVGPGGEVLSVELLRWTWKSLRALRDDEVSEVSLPSAEERMQAVLEIQITDEELPPYAELLGDQHLEAICAAMDSVIQFGRLFFLRQRMWDACPEITLELAQLLLEQKHRVLQCLGTRFVTQLLDADPARYQVCLRDLTRKSEESTPFAVILARAILNIAAPVLSSNVEVFKDGDEIEALWRGEWYPARFVKHDTERHEIEIEWKMGQEDSSDCREWRLEGWVRSPTKRGGYDYWRWLRERHLVEACALRKLLNRAPEHCLRLIQEPDLIASLQALRHQALYCGLLHLSAEAAGSLARLLRYGPSNSTAATATSGDLQDVQHLIVGLSDLGSKECLGEATNYLTTFAWCAQWSQDDQEEPAPAPGDGVTTMAAPSEPKTTGRVKRAESMEEDPAVKILEFLDLQKTLQHEQELRRAAEQQLQRKEEELHSSKETISKLLDEKKEMAQRILDLESELARSRAEISTSLPTRNTEVSKGMVEGGDGDAAEEKDWILQADPESLTLADVKDFISRIAERRDGVRVLRSSLCGGLRQLGENLYTSPVHFIEELLQNADDCSYGSSAEPSFHIDASKTSCKFSYNEMGFRAKDVLSLCSLAVSTKTRGNDFLGHKGIGFKSVFACSNCPVIVSGKFRFKFDVPGIDELSYITPRWLDDVQSVGLRTLRVDEGTHIVLPFRPELAGNEDFLDKLKSAVDPLVLLGLRRLRRLSFQMDGEMQVLAQLTKTAVESFQEISTWRACLRINDVDHFFRVFSTTGPGGGGSGSGVVVAFPSEPGAELPVCAGLPCARVGHRFLLQANWQLTTSREAVRESVENYQLRSEAAKLFGVAAQHPEILPHLAVFLPVAGPGTPPFWQSFTEEVLHELRLVLPNYLAALGGPQQGTALLRLPDERILALIPAEVFLLAGLQVVRDEMAQVVLQKCGIPAIGISEIFACFQYLQPEVMTDDWWAELFQLLLENAINAGVEESARRQPIWRIRGRSLGRSSLPENMDVAFCSVPTSLSPWRSQVVFLDTQSTAELRFALLTVARSWDALVMAQTVLQCHLDLRRNEFQVDQGLQQLLWNDLEFLRRCAADPNFFEELQRDCARMHARAGEVALVPCCGGHVAPACRSTVPTVLGCRLPCLDDVANHLVALPYGQDATMAVTEAIEWEDFFLKLGCQAPQVDARSRLSSTSLLPALEDLLGSVEKMKEIVAALPARSLQWLQENLCMVARSGQIVPLTSLVAETVLRNLPETPEGLEVVKVPMKMSEVAQLLGICVRPDAEMCWLILRSLCDASIRTVGPYIENLAMLQSLRCHGSLEELPESHQSQAILFLPSSNENGEPEFASLSEIYVSQELSNREKGMPKDQEEARVLNLGFQYLRRWLHRSVISCNCNVAYWSFHAELKLMGCAAEPSVADCVRALQLAAQEPSYRQRIGASHIKDRGELLNDHGLEVMLSLYRVLELALAAFDQRKTWSWEERLAPAAPAASAELKELPVVTWEGRVVTGESQEVWACRSSWWLDSVLGSTPICFVHRDIAEYCPRVVAANDWRYLEGHTTIVWQQSNNNPEKELTEVSQAFSRVLERPILVVSCNWIALELFFSPRVKPKEGEWFGDVPGIIKERLRAQPSFAMLGEGVMVLATHFVKEASERAALAAAALALAPQHAGKSRHDAEALARSTCENIRSFTSERFWESSSQSHAGYSIRQVRSTEVLLPNGLGEEATLPGLMGSFGEVEHYEDGPEGTERRLALPGLRRDHELFGEVLGRILSDHGTVSFRHSTGVPAHATDIAVIKEQQKRVGERAEHFYSCFLERVFGDAYKPTRDWVSSARSCVYPGCRSIDDAAGFDFVIVDTAQRIVPSQGKRSVRCFIEVKGCTGTFTGTFCLSANEQRKRDQIAASKGDGNAYVIAVVDNMDSLDFASIRHFIWSDNLHMLRLEPDSFLATVEPSAGVAVSGTLAAPPAPQVAKPPVPAPPAPRKEATPVATVSIPATAVGLVIGKGGTTVKWMSHESGAHIQLSGDKAQNNGLATLKIEGTKGQIEHAKQLIQEVVYSRSANSSWDARNSAWDARSGRVWRGSNGTNNSHSSGRQGADGAWQ